MRDCAAPGTLGTRTLRHRGAEPHAAFGRRIARVVLAACAVVSHLASPARLLAASTTVVHPAHALLDSLAASPAWHDARLSAVALDATTGDTLAARGLDRPMPPASVAKLAVAATALATRGAEARLATVCRLTGHAEGTTWHGDLVLRGGGDPNLSGRFAATPTAAFDAFADSLRAAGVHRLDGDLIGDAAAWHDEGPGPSWQTSDLGEWFGAVPSALSYNDNCVDVRVTPGARPGDRALLAAVIPGDVLRLHGAPITLPPGTPYRCDFARREGRRDATVRGTIAIDSPPRTAYASVPDPARFAIATFAEVLAQRGIAVHGHVRVRRAGDPPLPHAAHEWSWASRPLSDLVAVTNTRSQNLHAELLLRVIDPASPASRLGGLRAIRTTLAGLGVDTTAVTLDDACGLGRANRITARAWLQLLRGIDAQPAWREALWSSLPLAGRDSWLRSLAGTAAENRVRAKTGTLDGVRTLAGRADTAAGHAIFFVFLTDNAPDAAAQRAACRFAALLAATP